MTRKHFGGRAVRPLFVAAVAAVIAVMVTPVLAAGGYWTTYAKKASFEDVAQDLEAAIVNRGLKIDYSGNIAGMLDRTGEDVGSAKKVYNGARYFMFCSATLSRKMMEADAANIGYCPYVVFAYETADMPGEVVAGFRKLGSGSNEASVAVIKEVEDLLDGIVKEAMQ